MLYEVEVIRLRGNAVRLSAGKEVYREDLEIDLPKEMDNIDRDWET